MKSFQYGLVGPLAAALAASGLMVGCANEGQPREGVAVAQAPLLDELAEQCGLTCPAKGEGLVAGNASISGVASIDAFFGSVVNFDATARATSAGIDAQLRAIKADFGLAADADFGAEFEVMADTYLEAGLTIEAEPASCKADISASLEAQAKCDASVDPGKATVKCEGKCEAEAGVTLKCEGEAKLSCTFTNPSLACGGKCNGTCTAKLDASGKCEATCKGECKGTCSVMNADGSCNGECDGECGGTCEAALEADGSCMAQCEGECTATPPGGECDASAKASCEGSANAMVECSGSCDGDFEPPMAKAECQASAKADAKVNVQCTPPSIKVDYALKAGGSIDLAAQAKFEAGLKSLVKVRLPALLAALKKAELVADAGVELTGSASGAVSGAIDAAVDGDITLKQTIGLGCAATEIKEVGAIIASATTGLQASIEGAVDVKTAVGL